jgi:drug/metabolite transporter (DMT)-like permease
VSSRRLPTAALILATVAVSFSAIFIRIAGDDPATIVWVRMALATVLLLPWAVRDLRHRAATAEPQPPSLVITSGLLLAGHFLLWTISLQYTSVAASVLLVSVHPLIVVPLSRRVLHERVGVRTVIAIAIALSGTVLTCVGDLHASLTALYGDAFALGGAVCLAGYLIIGRNLRAQLGVAAYSAMVYAVVAVVAAVSALLLGTAHLPSQRTVLLGLALAVVCTLGGHTVYNWALRHVRAATVSVAFLGEPPLTSLLAALLLSTVPGLTTIVGGVLILAGLACALTERMPQQELGPAVALE